MRCVWECLTLGCRAPKKHQKSEKLSVTSCEPEHGRGALRGPRFIAVFPRLQIERRLYVAVPAILILQRQTPTSFVLRQDSNVPFSPK